MAESNKEKANRDQINTFLNAYYSEWRYIEILSIEKRLAEKYEFYADIIEQVKKTDNSAGEHTIAQAVSNGLMFEAIQHSIQYIEDLFAFIHAAKNKTYFIRNIIQYNAGKIENSINSFKFEKKYICEKFQFPFYPDDKDYTDEERKTWGLMQEAIDRLGGIVKEVIEYHKTYRFFYNQYKHGLSIALRPYGHAGKERVEQDKKGEANPYPVALDSLNFKNAERNQYGNKGYLMMPAFTNNVRPLLNLFQKENNLLRYVLPPEGTEIENIVNIAEKTKRCLQILMHNFISVVNDTEKMNLRLPAEKDDEVLEFYITVDQVT
jgi:hypothetical protein